MGARKTIYNALGGLAQRISDRGQRRVAASRTPTRRGFRRSYTAGAPVNRLTNDWNASDLTADEIIYPALIRMRSRSRDLSRNNDYAKRYFNLLKTNVVGHQGIRLQVRSKDAKGTLDTGANALVEAGWKEYGKVGNCTTCGKLSWIDVLNTALESVARDGEILVKKVTSWEGNKFQFAVQLIESDMLDINKNDVLPDGVTIRMGVQRDKYKRTTAYWIKTSTGRFAGDSEPIPANEIIHLYRPDRVGQSRGVPETAAPATRLKQIDAHEEAHVIASRVGASKMGFFTSTEGGTYTGDDEDENGDIIMEADPGTFEQLPQGVDFKAWDPQFPVSTFAEFEAAVLRGISSGLNVSYISLANDLKGVSYSSIRQGELSDRDYWRVLQTWMIEHLCQPIFEEWLKWALLTQAVKLPYGKIDKFNAAVWRPRGWAWVDPFKESRASENDVKNQFKSLHDVAAERGYDLEEIFEANKRAKDLAKTFKLSIPTLEDTPTL